MSNEELLNEYKKCIAILCKEVISDETNDNIPKLKQLEKEILERMK